MNARVLQGAIPLMCDFFWSGVLVLLMRMIFLERRDDEKLTETYLTMVRDIYYDPALQGYACARAPPSTN